MKMKYTFALLFTMISSFIFAQSTINFYQDADTVQMADTIGLGYEYDFKGHVDNLTANPIQSTWSVVNRNFPNQNWTIYVCDDNLCYTPQISSRTQTIPANGTSLVKATIWPNSQEVGSATIRVADDATGETQEFMLTVDATNGGFIASAHSLANVVTFTQNAPNPFDNYTVVKYDLKGNEGRLIVTDIAGRQVNEYNLNADAGQIEIGQDLEVGVYFYSLLVDGRVVTTKRLQKL